MTMFCKVDYKKNIANMIFAYTQLFTKKDENWYTCVFSKMDYRKNTVNIVGIDHHSVFSENVKSFFFLIIILPMLVFTIFNLVLALGIFVYFHL